MGSGVKSCKKRVKIRTHGDVSRGVTHHQQGELGEVVAAAHRNLGGVRHQLTALAGPRPITLVKTLVPERALGPRSILGGLVGLPECDLHRFVQLGPGQLPREVDADHPHVAPQHKVAPVPGPSVLGSSEEEIRGVVHAHNQACRPRPVPEVHPGTGQIRWLQTEPVLRGDRDDDGVVEGGGRDEDEAEWFVGDVLDYGGGVGVGQNLQGGEEAEGEGRIE